MEAIQGDLVLLEDYPVAEGRSEVRHEYLAGMVYHITLNLGRRSLE